MKVNFIKNCLHQAFKGRAKFINLLIYLKQMTSGQFRFVYTQRQKSGHVNSNCAVN